MKQSYSILLPVLCVYLTFCGQPLASEAAPGVLGLCEALSMALENNAIVMAANENLHGAQFENQSAKAERMPRITANYSYTGLCDDPYLQVMGMPPPAQIAAADQYHWDLTLVQPLFSGFALSSRHDMAKLGIEIKAQQKQQAILEVTKGLKSAYFDVLLTRKLLCVADDAIKSLDSHAKDAQRYYDQGVIRLNDLLRAKVALSNAIQNRERARAAARMAVSDLNRWLAVDINHDTHIEEIETVPAQTYRLEEVMPLGMQQRPLLQALRLSLETHEKAIKLAQSEYFPSVALVGGYERNGDDPLASNNDFSNRDNAFFGIKATWTLFDSAKTRARVDEAKSDHRAFAQTIRSTEDGIRLEIKNAYLNLEVAEKNIETSKTTLAQAGENLRITRLGYRHQAATSTEVLDARADLSQAQSNYYIALYGYLDALAALERAIGQGPQG